MDLFQLHIWYHVKHSVHASHAHIIQHNSLWMICHPWQKIAQNNANIIMTFRTCVIAVIQDINWSYFLLFFFVPCGFICFNLPEHVDIVLWKGEKAANHTFTSSGPLTHTQRIYTNIKQRYSDV